MPETTTTTTTIQTAFNIEPFDTTRSQWSRWVRRLEAAFEVFNVPANRKVSYMLHYMGPEAYEILCDKSAPDDPHLKDYQDLVDTMQNYYNPKPLEIAENFRFHQRKQQEGEGIQDYVIALQKLAINCQFGEKSERGDAGMEATSYGSPRYGYSNMWHLELALTVAVGSVLVAALLVCYVYVFRQLCCPPPRHHRHGRRGKPAGDDLNPGQTARSNTRHESLPMTNVTSQPTETERL